MSLVKDEGLSEENSVFFRWWLDSETTGFANMEGGDTP